MLDLTLEVDKTNVPTFQYLLDLDLRELEIMKKETFETWEKLGTVIALKKGD